MDDLELLRSFRSAPAGLDQEDVDAAWRRLEPMLEPPSLQAVASSRGHVWRTGLAAAAALVVALAIPVLLPDAPGGADRAAAAALRRAAAVAARQPPDSWPGPGEYLYTRSRAVETYYYAVGDGLPNFTYVVPGVYEDWRSLDGSGRHRYVYDQVRFPSPMDRAAWIAAGSPKLHEDMIEGDRVYGPGEMHMFDLSSLPTDPEELLRAIEEREVIGGPPGDWETFMLIGDLLHEPAPPQVRSALFEAAALVQGIEYLGRREVAGRRGVVIAYTHGGMREERIFDQATGEMLGERLVVIDPDEVLEITPETWPGTIYGGYTDRPNTVVGSSIVLESGVVASADERP